MLENRAFRDTAAARGNVGKAGERTILFVTYKRHPVQECREYMQATYRVHWCDIFVTKPRTSLMRSCNENITVSMTVYGHCRVNRCAGVSARRCRRRADEIDRRAIHDRTLLRNKPDKQLCIVTSLIRSTFAHTHIGMRTLKMRKRKM